MRKGRYWRRLDNWLSRSFELGIQKIQENWCPMLYWQVLVLLKYIAFWAGLMFSYMLGRRRKILLLERRRSFGPYKHCMRRTNDRGQCRIVQQRIGDGYHRNTIGSEFLSKLAFSRKKCNVLRTSQYKFFLILVLH